MIRTRNGEHRWFTVSRHLTADGLVAYQRCTCGRWRVLENSEPVSAPGRARPGTGGHRRVARSQGVEATAP